MSDSYIAREILFKYGRRRTLRGPISHSGLAVDLLRSIVPDDTQESFMVLYLDAKNMCVGWKVLGTGDGTSCAVDMPALFRGAIAASANAILVGHNHPSGYTTPSAHDLELTDGICKAAKLLGFRVLDHVVIGDDYTSLRDNGLWPKGDAGND